MQIGNLIGILKLKYQENKLNSYPSSTCQSALNVKYIGFLPCVLFFILLSMEVFLISVLYPTNSSSKLCEITIFSVSRICLLRWYHCKVPCFQSVICKKLSRPFSFLVFCCVAVFASLQNLVLPIPLIKHSSSFNSYSRTASVKNMN